jgi:hypothetical protein
MTDRRCWFSAAQCFALAMVGLSLTVCSSKGDGTGSGGAAGSGAAPSSGAAGGASGSAGKRGHPNGRLPPLSEPPVKPELPPVSPLAVLPLPLGVGRSGDELIFRTEPFTLGPGQERFVCYTHS